MSTSCVQNTATGRLQQVCMARGVASKATAEVSGATRCGTPRAVRLVLAEFDDPTRLVRLGPVRFRALAVHRGIRMPRPVPERPSTTSMAVPLTTPPRSFVLTARWVHHGSERPFRVPDGLVPRVS